MSLCCAPVEAAFQIARTRYPQAHHWLIACGYGNNGGDGYVVARLAQAAGLQVTLLAVESDKSLPEEASQAREAWLDAGGVPHDPDKVWPADVDLIVDALLGIGLNSAPRENLSQLVSQMNEYPAPVVALDVPSGLLAETGAVPGSVVQAEDTVTFIALKPGLLTGKARDVVGRAAFCLVRA
ncbi:Nicotinamide nucleotide repair protein [Cedecea neteri]|uniref:Nicotinamide nucleotide repair protein n=1 Tax=Cedecea neteri TaxID=158822 RepID=A0A2X2SX52_9ENTR|nr:Nicotinamide nucleotide repair protein [Cedecea neteri]